jgi:hypothetical protein
MAFITLRRVWLLSLLNLLIGMLGLLLFVPPAAAQESFLVGTDDSTVSLYDLSTYNFQKKITVAYPTWAAVLGRNPRLAFLCGYSGYLSVVDLTISRETKRIYDVWGSAAALSSDGNHLLVWDDIKRTLDIVDIASLTVARRVNLGPLRGNAQNSGSVVVVGNKAYLVPYYADVRYPAPAW